MLVQYGPVNLNLTRIDKYDRVPVYHNGINYLYTRHTLTVEATFNPCVQSDSLQGSNPPSYDANNSLGLTWVPPAVPNQLPAPVGPLQATPAVLSPTGSQRNRGPLGGAMLPGAWTAEAVKHALAQPRQQLIFSVGGVVILRSPLQGLSVDANNGPVTRDISVSWQAGTRTWKVRFTVETDVNQAPLFGNPSNILHAVLSHRWSMEHRLDTEFFTQRVINGRLVFRSDVMNLQNFKPDDFRQFFFFPIPKGFARREINVKALDDENTVDYQIVDVELPVGWTQAHVTRVEAAHSFVMERANLEQVAANAVLEAARLTALPQAPVIGEGTHLLPALTLLGAKTALDALPVSTNTCVVEVWGDAFSNRNDLTDFAYNIIKGRINTLVALVGIFAGGTRFEVVHFPTEKHVRCSATFTTGPQATTALLVTGQFSINSLFKATDDTGTLLQQGATPSGPANDNKSRSNYLEECVAGALTGDASTGAQAQASPPAPAVRGQPDVGKF